MTLLYVAWLFMAQFLYFGLFEQHPPGPRSFSEIVQLRDRRNETGALVH